MPSSTNNLIACTPGVRSGTTRVAGTRITVPVPDVLECLSHGFSHGKKLTDFRGLRAEQVMEVLCCAAEREKRHRMVTVF